MNAVTQAVVARNTAAERSVFHSPVSVDLFSGTGAIRHNAAACSVDMITRGRKKL